MRAKRKNIFEKAGQNEKQNGNEEKRKASLTQCFSFRCDLVRITDPSSVRAVDKILGLLHKPRSFCLSTDYELKFASPEMQNAHPKGEHFIRVTSSGETSNFLMEDLERVLLLETLENTIR